MDLILVAGLDYPNTYREFVAMFPDDRACATYLTQLHWPVAFEIVKGMDSNPRIVGVPEVVACNLRTSAAVSSAICLRSTNWPTVIPISANVWSRLVSAGRSSRTKNSMTPRTPSEPGRSEPGLLHAHRYQSCGNRCPGLTGCAKTISARENFDGPHVRHNGRTPLQDAQKGRSARPQQVKARRRTLWGTLRV